MKMVINAGTTKTANSTEKTICLLLFAKMEVNFGLKTGHISEVNKDEQAMWNRLKEPAPIINEFGAKEWYNNAGELHRENDLPAVIFNDGSREWYMNGKVHRENDLPALIYKDGSKLWYNKAGKLHRENDLPAIIWADGSKEWYLNGKCQRVEN